MLGTHPELVIAELSVPRYLVLVQQDLHLKPTQIRRRMECRKRRALLDFRSVPTAHLHIGVDVAE